MVKRVKKKLQKRKNKQLIKVAAVFVLLIAVFYGNSLKNSFVHDDIGQVVQNEYVHSWRYFPKVFTGCTWEYVFGGNCQDSSYYRPLHSLSYLITWTISSQPWFFHLVNLFYLFLSIILVFVLIRKLTNDFLVSFLTALFFLIHPINNEAINWTSCVPELLFAVFTLLSLVFFIKYRERKKIKDLIFCCLAYCLAMFAKEPAISLPIIFLFLDWRVFKKKLIYFVERKETVKPEGLSGNEEIPSEEDFDLGVRLNFKEIKTYFVFLAIALIFIGARIAVLGSSTGPRQLYFGYFSVAERVYVFITLFGQYIQKLFYPRPLNFFYYFEKKASFISWEFFASGLAIIAFVSFIIYLLKKRQDIPAMFLLWIFLFLWPVLFFVYYAGENVFSERYLFVPSIGFSFLLASAFRSFWQRRKQWRTFLAAIIALVVIISWLVIYPRNKIFANDYTLYLATLKINPRAHALRRNYAAELMANGDYESARIELEKIMAMDTNWWEIDKVYNMLGDYYRETGNEAKAIEFYEKTIEVSGEWNYKPYNNLGALYLRKGEYLMAMPYLCRASQLGGTAPEVKNNFERIVFLFESIKNQEGLKKLYAEITGRGIYQEGEEQKISYLESFCLAGGESCTFVFLSQTGQREYLLPFLFLASTADGEMLEIKNRSFDAQKGTISLEIEVKDKDESLLFIFPTCDRIYYKVKAED